MTLKVTPHPHTNNNTNTITLPNNSLATTWLEWISHIATAKNFHCHHHLPYTTHESLPLINQNDLITAIYWITYFAFAYSFEPLILNQHIYLNCCLHFESHLHTNLLLCKMLCLLFTLVFIVLFFHSTLY